MFKAEFDNHRLWSTLSRVEQQLDTILESGDASELSPIERIKVQMAYVRSFDKIAETRVTFFHTKMLEDAREIWVNVEATLHERVNAGEVTLDLVESAANLAESALNVMGPWPRAYGRGGEVSQLKVLFAELLEAQEASIQSLAARHSGFTDRLTQLGNEIDEKKDKTFAKFGELESQLSALESKITEDKSSIETSLQGSRTTIDELVVKNDENFQAWITEREEAFKTDFAPFMGQIADKLKEADSEFTALQATKSDYSRLISRRAGDEVAYRFEKEAKFGRVWGIGLYIVGAILIVGAAVPLALLLLDPEIDSSTDISWNRILIRAAIGILAGSAAAVLIRLGSRFLTSANQSKRMELELKAIGPFLANVNDGTQVDKAMIDLIGRSFGKTYGTQYTGKVSSKSDTTDDEVDALGVATKGLNLAEEALKRFPAPGQ